MHSSTYSATSSEVHPGTCWRTSLNDMERDYVRASGLRITHRRSPFVYASLGRSQRARTQTWRRPSSTMSSQQRLQSTAPSRSAPRLCYGTTLARARQPERRNDHTYFTGFRTTVYGVQRRTHKRITRRTATACKPQRTNGFATQERRTTTPYEGRTAWGGSRALP